MKRAKSKACTGPLPEGEIVRHVRDKGNMLRSSSFSFIIKRRRRKRPVLAHVRKNGCSVSNAEEQCTVLNPSRAVYCAVHIGLNIMRAGDADTATSYFAAAEKPSQPAANSLMFRAFPALPRDSSFRRGRQKYSSVRR